MSFVPKKPNTGSIFPNTRKEPGSSQPDMTGNIFLDRTLLIEQLKSTPEGEFVKFDVSGWNNDGGRIGLGVSKPYVKPERQTENKVKAADPDPDNEVPF